MSLDNPKVSIVMSVYNGERFLMEAVDSILNQIFQDFEFIIVNDGSTDKTGEILGSYDDPRLVILHQENMGLTKSLNRAIAMSKGEYIARMDADDISLPKRFELQVDYLDRNKDVGILGCRYYQINENNDIEHVFDVPLEDDELRKSLWTTKHIGHGTFMIRKGILDMVGYYNEEIKYAQDYELLLRIAEVSRMHNLEEILYKWRRRSDAISATKAIEQKSFAILSSITALQRKIDKTQQMLPHLADRETLRLDYDRLAYLYRGLGILFLTNSSPKEARTRFWEYIRLRPHSLAAYILLIATFLPPRITLWLLKWKIKLIRKPFLNA